ncbi:MULTISPECIES: DNA gyrase subunit A [Helcococcus]|uniref:DNA gyrase subunit A n=1 Tax=Helcococcus bovis TaxID=3153252 RepID=A0ABW9F778_9FIRM
MAEFDKSNIIAQDIETKMKEAYLDYSMSVIVSRALPDVRDGLKPVHRRILYGMNQLGLAPNKPHRKSARLVGEVMGRFHPHGDSAIYDAVVRLAQDFNTRYPLVDGQGNFGSIDGDGAAAQRYTEVRMTKLTLEMLREINKDTVDFQPNFDEEELEPKVLPARFPNLLVNGSAGIAVGMATNMAPHNLGEVIDGCVAFIDDNEITVEGLMKHIKGPDFPTGANIMGRKPIIDAYKTGRGKVKLRAEAHIEEFKSKHIIVVTEIPYQVNRARLIMKIAELVRDKKLEGIADLRDESNRNGTRIVIETKRDANPNVVLNNLYKHTQLTTTFGIINLALVDGVPKVLTLKELIHYYIEHQKEVVTRRTKFDLDKAEARAHIVEGLRIAYDNIDEIVKIIRSNYDDEEIKKEFTKRFGLTDIQGQAILDMQLKRLNGLNVEKLEEEYNELLATIKRLKEILADESILMGIIKGELLEIKEKYSDERRTRIKRDVEEVDEEDLIEEEEVIITLTNQGYIKRLPADTYKVQNRGGRGVTGMTTKEDDFVQNLFVTSTHDNILFFTNKGKVFKKKAFEIKEGKRQSKGQAIINILQLTQDEKVSAVIPVKEQDDDKFIILATKEGKIKRIEASEFYNIRTTGIIAITLNEGDELIGAREVDPDTNVLMVTENGQSIIFNLKDVRPMGRTAQGVKGISLNKGDNVVDLSVIDKNEYIFIVTEKGYGKKTLIKYYSPQNRGGKGVKTYKLTPKTGKIVASKLVNQEDQIILVSANGEIIRLNVKDISTMGRTTQGVRLKKVRSDEENIVACAKYIEEVE